MTCGGDLLFFVLVARRIVAAAPPPGIRCFKSHQHQRELHCRQLMMDCLA